MKLILTTTFVLIFATVFGQTQNQKNVIVTKYVKTVPPGKKWTLEAGKSTKVQVSEGVLNSGSMCNAMFLSNPSMIFNVNRGTVFKAESYIIVFENLEKVPYTNDYTYELTPISIVDKNFSLSDFQYKKPEDVGVKKIVFNAGESVFVASCLESIEMIEEDMTKQELADEKKKNDAIKKANDEKAINFNIPINPEKYVEPGKKPVLKDSLIEYVVFESPAVVFRTRDQRGGYDDVHQWTLTLTQNEFEMRTSGIDETYTVLGAKYDEQLKFQEFQLADETGQFTHKLNVCYSNSSQSYMVLFSSIDNKDDFQFQEVTIKEIQYQNK